MQRLEFLGDAVLDHLITVHLYNKYPGMTPGLITDLRSASVNNACYAHVAAKAGLNKHILHASSELHKQMTFYLNNFTQSFSGPSYGWEAGAALPKVRNSIYMCICFLWSEQKLKINCIFFMDCEEGRLKKNRELKK